jgi:hypothetical protein
VVYSLPECIPTRFAKPIQTQAAQQTRVGEEQQDEKIKKMFRKKVRDGLKEYEGCEIL